MRHIVFLMAFFLLTSATPAMAAYVVGGVCTQMGATLMATDQKNLIACLKNDSGALVWKGMTTATPAAQIKAGTGNLVMASSGTYSQLTVEIVSKFAPQDGSHTGFADYTVFVNGAAVGTISNSISVSKTGKKGHYWGYQNTGVSMKTFNVVISPGMSVQVHCSSSNLLISSDIVANLSQ